MKKLSWWRALVAVVQASVILVLGAILAEIAFRVVHRVSPRYIFPAASYNYLRPQPHTVFDGMPLNSQGFRDVEYEQAKPPGTYRILGLGDSFAFGVVPYADNFLTLLDEELDEVFDGTGAAGDRTVEVINMGISRASPADYFSLFLHEGARLDPDLVLLCFYLGNDFRIHPAAGKGSSSYLLSFLHYLFRIYPEFEGQSEGSRPYVDTEPTFLEESYLRVLRNRLAQYRRKDAEIHEKTPLVATYLANIRRICERRGVGFVVAIFPDEMQLDEMLRRQLFASMPGKKAEDFDFSLPNKVLIAELERQKIPSDPGLAFRHARCASLQASRYASEYSRQPRGRRPAPRMVGVSYGRRVNERPRGTR